MILTYLESQVHHSEGLATLPIVTGIPLSNGSGFSIVIIARAVCRTGDSTEIVSNTSGTVVRAVNSKNVYSPVAGFVKVMVPLLTPSVYAINLSIRNNGKK